MGDKRPNGNKPPKLSIASLFASTTAVISAAIWLTTLEVGPLYSLALFFVLVGPPVGLILSITATIAAKRKEGDGQEHPIAVVALAISGLFTFGWIFVLIFYLLLSPVYF
jgi:hypothetical protein